MSMCRTAAKLVGANYVPFRQVLLRRDRCADPKRDLRRVRQRVRERMQKIRIGHRSIRRGQIGAVVNAKPDAACSVLEQSQSRRAACGAAGLAKRRLHRTLYPTRLLAGSLDKRRRPREEIFGPVGHWRNLQTEEEAIAMANDHRRRIANRRLERHDQDRAARVASHGAGKQLVKPTTFSPRRSYARNKSGFGEVSYRRKR